MQKQKGFIIPLTTAIVVILAIGGGVYYYLDKPIKLDYYVHQVATTTALIGGDKDTHSYLGPTGYSSSTPRLPSSDSSLKIAKCQSKAQTQKDSDIENLSVLISTILLNSDLNKYKTLLIKSLATNLTSQELAQLPKDMQDIIASGYDAIQLQINDLNRQIVQMNEKVKSELQIQAQKDYDEVFSDCLNN